MQMETWAGHLQQYAMIIGSHQPSFHKATEAIADLHGMEHELSISAAKKFAELDGDAGELRQFLQQHDPGSKAVVDQLAGESKAKVSKFESSLAQGRWVELIDKDWRSMREPSPFWLGKPPR